MLRFLQHWLTDNTTPEQRVPFTSFCINGSYASEQHRDSGNVGMSNIVAVGDYSGGQLYYWQNDDRTVPATSLPLEEASTIDIRTVFKFDGHKAHATAPYQGTRWSIIWYSVLDFSKITAAQKQLMADAGLDVSSIDVATEHVEEPTYTYDSLGRRYQTDKYGDRIRASRRPKGCPVGWWRRASEKQKLDTISAFRQGNAAAAATVDDPVGTYQMVTQRDEDLAAAVEKKQQNCTLIMKSTKNSSNLIFNIATLNNIDGSIIHLTYPSTPAWLVPSAKRRCLIRRMSRPKPRSKKNGTVYGTEMFGTPKVYSRGNTLPAELATQVKLSILDAYSGSWWKKDPNSTKMTRAANTNIALSSKEIML